MVKLPGVVSWAEEIKCATVEGEIRCEWVFMAQEMSAETFLFARAAVGEGKNQMLPVDSCDPSLMVTVTTASGDRIDQSVRVLLRGELTQQGERCVLMVERIEAEK